MTRQGRWRNVLARGVLLAGLIGSPGCFRHLHPVEPPPPPCVEACQEIPKCCRDHVYIFLVQGIDFVDCANLKGLRCYLNQLGFKQTFECQLYHGPCIEREMAVIHRCDPDARFVLIGFSFGANEVRDIAHHVRAAGIGIDLLVYLGGNTLANCPYDRPVNACQVLNILARGCIWNGATLDHAVNVHEPDVGHFGTPTHPHTLELLTCELLALAGSVPYYVPEVAPLPELIEEAPTPRPVPPEAPRERDEWDFLKPVSRLKRPRPVAPEPTPRPVPEKIAAR
jgi:hypothetical protein